MTDANAPRAASDTTSAPHSKEILGERSPGTNAAGSAGTPPPPAGSGRYAGRPSATPASAPAGQRRALYGLTALLVLTIIGGGAGGYFLSQRFDNRIAALDKHVSQSDNTLAQTGAKTDESLTTSHQLENQLAALSSKFADAQTQQQALEQLYQDLARNRDDWVMTDAEQTLSTANQQLQLTGNIQLALFALQNADTQLASANGPQVLIVRRAIAGDIDKLKSTPAIDLPGLALRLDQAIAKIDTMPMAGDVPAAAVAVAASGSSTVVTSGASPLSRVYWEQLWARITASFSGSASRVVQIRRIDPGSANAMLVAPQQAQYLRENVKLRLLSARLSLLSRNEATMDADLSAADDAVARYFDPSSPDTGVVRTTIADVKRAAQQVAIPTLDGSLQALRQTKSRG